MGPRGAKLSKTLTEVSTSRLLNKKLKLNIQTTAFFIFIKSFPDGLGTRTPKPDNQHSVNSQHGADGEERSSPDWRRLATVFLSVFRIKLYFYLCISLKKYPILGEEGPSELGGGGEAVEPVQFLPLPHRLPG